MHRVLLVALALTAAPLAAQDPPPIVIDGLKSFIRSGIDTAVTVWLKGSPIQDDSASKARLTEAFGSLLDFNTDRAKILPEGLLPP